MKDHIQYDFLYDNQFAELKESEMIQNRLGILAQIEPYIGKFYSTEYVRKRVKVILKSLLKLMHRLMMRLKRVSFLIQMVWIQSLENLYHKRKKCYQGEGNGMEGMGADVMGMGDIPMDPNEVWQLMLN